MLPVVEYLNQNYKLILASGSKRRHELFKSLGFEFRVVLSDFAEDWDSRGFPEPREYVKATCVEKSRQVKEKVDIDDEQLSIIISCDTVIVSEGRVLEKPTSRQEAQSMLKSFMASEIQVISAVCIAFNDQSGLLKEVVFDEITTLVMQDYPEDRLLSLIDGYLDATPNHQDLAGGLAIQGHGMILVKSINGCYQNVVGFPMSKFYSVISELIHQNKL